MQKFMAVVAFTLSLLITSALTLGGYLTVYGFRYYAFLQKVQREQKTQENPVSVESKAAYLVAVH